jgi:geranylgeranyl reductase family protein
MNGDEFDVAVVGAGPAGSIAAWHLAKAGRRVAVFEKTQVPRYKVCGGGLLQRTLRLLPDGAEVSVERECFRAELRHHDPRLVYSTSRDKPIVSMVMRDRFDFQLLQLAIGEGAKFFPQTAVQGLARCDSGIKLHTEAGSFSAEFVIAADGVSSMVARRAGFPELRDVAPALECELEIDAERFVRACDTARFDFGFVPLGYGWVFPKKAHLSVGVLSVSRGACNLNREYERYRSEVGLDGATAEERHGYMIPLRPREKLFDFPRIFLVGDAAGLADPITAEGISHAIRSGQLAAAAILQAEGEPGVAMAAYRTTLRKEILSELAIARVLARILYRRRKIRGWVLSRHGQRLSEFVTDIVMGTASYRELVRTPRHFLKLLPGLG